MEYQNEVKRLASEKATLSRQVDGLTKRLKELSRELLCERERQAANIVTITRINEPEDYKSMKAENAELKKLVQKYERIVQYGNISTIESSVERIYGYMQPEINSLIKAAHIMAGTREEQKKLKELRDYFRKLDAALSRFIANDENEY